MTYDFHGSWESNADHHSKLYNDTGNFDADSTVKKWIASGASAGKLVLGVPLYGRSFTLSTSQKTPPAPASGGGEAGSITGVVGYLSYLEICTYINNGWNVSKDSTGVRGPYAYSVDQSNQWVGYDDVDMVRIKAQYVKSEGLGGTMVWAIDLTDFNKSCSNESYPLLKAMWSELHTSRNCGTTESRVMQGPVPKEQPNTLQSSCCSQFVCPEDGLWADPCDCQKYYQCSHGNGYQYSCGEGKLWFQNLKNCTWASECTKPSLPVCEGNASYVCSSSNDTVNMMCSDGSTATFKCPINLAWSSSAMNCVPFSDPTAGC
ncbi:chitotriosidase-1-like [Palaemon carinicauda]|uniref:chitotriosidase-1-like n=1 Tax=Palaemon carinicauda TaxID=392227 RepID=UPI0035B67A0D